MGQPFANPVVGGGGALVVPLIRSPNFSISGQTGWAIMANGDAYFYDVTATGISSTTVVVSGAGEGVFVYSGTPAAGSLVSTVTSAAGTDSFGNAYLEGSTSYVNDSGFYSAANLNGGVVTWYEAATYAGPWNEEASIGFAFTNGVGGGLVFTGTLATQFESENGITVSSGLLGLGLELPPGYPAAANVTSCANVINQVVSILQNAGIW